MRLRVQASEKIETIFCNIGNFILSSGSNQQQAFLITQKFADFTQDVLKVFSSFLPNESLDTMNVVIINIFRN